MDKAKCEKLRWKVTAIIFICLFVGLLAFNIWSISLALEEEESTYNCYYNICEDYPEAWYEEGLCSCYNIDEYGEYEVVKTIYK